MLFLLFTLVNFPTSLCGSNKGLGRSRVDRVAPATYQYDSSKGSPLPTGVKDVIMGLVMGKKAGDRQNPHLVIPMKFNDVDSPLIATEAGNRLDKPEVRDRSDSGESAPSPAETRDLISMQAQQSFYVPQEEPLDLSTHSRRRREGGIGNTPEDQNPAGAVDLQDALAGPSEVGNRPLKRSAENLDDTKVPLKKRELKKR
ncbi:hypothetical protein FOL47_006672 [Perkinsus chesapeaki]|uniref:Uncharacterized protein n=1 Tax=Perkinsus chesapeaki TaxID=330153 RepID=A0A7J6LRE7_PERCH|nr:hypothetical protein FOL47_006672 [Perkinsus chesapeaki]